MLVPPNAVFGSWRKERETEKYRQKVRKKRHDFHWLFSSSSFAKSNKEIPNIKTCNKLFFVCAILFLVKVDLEGQKKNSNIYHLEYCFSFCNHQKLHSKRLQCFCILIQHKPMNQLQEIDPVDGNRCSFVPAFNAGYNIMVLTIEIK